MLKHSLPVIVLALALICGDALACSCMSRGEFVEYAKQSEAVIRAKVVRHGPKLEHGETLHASMKVKVVSVLKGKLELDTVELMGDPGFMCWDYVDSSVFRVGKEFLIALHSDEKSQPFGGCGEAWLEVAGDLAKGYRWTNGESLRYSIELKELIIRLNTE